MQKKMQPSTNSVFEDYQGFNMDPSNATYARGFISNAQLGSLFKALSNPSDLEEAEKIRKQELKMQDLALTDKYL